MDRRASFPAYAALASVCFFWGTTYLAIRMGLESFPPALLMGVRFTASGAILLACAQMRSAVIPRGRELWVAVVTGILTCGIGTGTLVFAELWIPSGLAALIISFSPFWMVGLEALTGGERLHKPTIAGMLVGCVGAVLLVWSSISRESVGSAAVFGFVLLQIGSAGWAFGSIYQRRQPSRAHPIVTGAVQQLAAGLCFLVPSFFMHEHPVVSSFKGIAALAYLIVFGSIVGYSSYVYALNHLRVAVVSLYTYVNPVVAVFLGWVFYREPFGPREAAAMAIIFSGVALVKRYSK